jgi:hypothetical protein
VVGTKTKRARSSIQFPYYDLDDGVSIADTVYRRVGAGSCTIDQIAAWLGHSTTRSGAFRLRLSAARMFGFLELGDERVALTEIGRRVITPDAADEARVEAFLNIDLYAKLFARYRAHPLPPDSALEAEMIALGVIPNQAAKARQTFIRSADEAGFFREGRHRLVRPASGSVSRKQDSEGSTTESDLGERPKDRPRIEIAQPLPEQHPFVVGLLGTLPSPGEVWPEDERKKWLQTAESIFALLYRDQAD